MRVALLQTDPPAESWENAPAAFPYLREQIARAADGGARLCVLPEMAACGYSMRSAVVAEPLDGATATFLREQAAQHGVVVAASVPIRGEGGALPTNSLLLVGPGGVLARYDKLHPFTFADEHLAYAAGDAPVIASVDGVRLGLTVCYDLRFADLYWRLAADVDAFLVVANWPAKRREHWRALLRARAIENQAYVVAVNRVGSANGLGYAGDSALIDPQGVTLVEATEREAVLFGELDPSAVAAARARFPVLRDRRER